MVTHRATVRRPTALMTSTIAILVLTRAIGSGQNLVIRVTDRQGIPLVAEIRKLQPTDQYYDDGVLIDGDPQGMPSRR